MADKGGKVCSAHFCPATVDERFHYCLLSFNDEASSDSGRSRPRDN